MEKKRIKYRAAYDTTINETNLNAMCTLNCW